MDDTACNYDINATIDNGSCYNNDLGCGCDTPAAELGYDCEGNCLSDFDGDGVCDFADDCPFNPLETQDSDNDEICDGEDNCPDDYNPLQEDIDSNGIGDICDEIRVEEDFVNRNVIQVVDVLGRKANPQTLKTTLLYIYDDGSVEKITLIK